MRASVDPARAHEAIVRRARRARMLLATVALVAGACRGSGGPAGPQPKIAGHWSGTAEFHTVTFAAQLTESGDSVGGTGHVSSPRGSADFTVTGTVSGSDVQLYLFAEGVGTSGFKGRFTGADRIEGTLTVPSNDHYALTIYRD